jgi:hypothetical protein
MYMHTNMNTSMDKERDRVGTWVHGLRSGHDEHVLLHVAIFDYFDRNFDGKSGDTVPLKGPSCQLKFAWKW